MEALDDYEPVGLQKSSTSFFSTPERNLDPVLFSGMRMHDHVREWILSTVHEFLDDKFFHSREWSRIWVSGSGVSYQWSAAREPADLDVMLGINYVKFRHLNPVYVGMSDSDIARIVNEYMFTELYPEVDEVTITENSVNDDSSSGGSVFEVTVYVNKGVTDNPDGILLINPYAAYDVTQDEWAVPPDPKPMVRVHPSWDVTVETDRQRAKRIIEMYGNTLNAMRSATNPAHRVNAERTFNSVLDAAEGLYEEIHSGRRAAFGIAGRGYSDFANYRWQSGKASGAIQAMKRLKDYAKSRREATEFETYGMELPDHDTLVRRAMMAYRTPR